MQSNEALTRAGVLPIKICPVRFAVGDPAGLTSNSWRLWISSNNDIYIACRDNFTEAKVSLHISGKWRMGFTREAISKRRVVLQPDQDRAWEVWDRPPESPQNVVTAFRLLFPASELAVAPHARKSAKWKDVAYIEAPPPGKLTVVTLFITSSQAIVMHKTEPSFCLALLEVGDGHFAQLIAHADPELNLTSIIDAGVREVRQMLEVRAVAIPDEAYAYFLGNLEDGSRYLVGARINL